MQPLICDDYHISERTVKVKLEITRPISEGNKLEKLPCIQLQNMVGQWVGNGVRIHISIYHTSIQDRLNWFGNVFASAMYTLGPHGEDGPKHGEDALSHQTRSYTCHKI